MKKLLAIFTALLTGAPATAQAAEPASRNELSGPVHPEAKRLSTEADALAKEGRYSEAIPIYWQAWDLLPEPEQMGNAGLRLLTAIGDADFLVQEYAACRDNLSSAMHIPGAIGTPFLHLRLGQCQYELGNMERAQDELARAYISEGKAIFANDDQKYLNFIKSKLKPPRGGWPKGW